MKKGQVISKTAKLTPAQNPGGGKSAGELVRSSNRWRDNYNPLRGLVIAKVVAMLESAERGDYAELQMTLRKIEKRYPVLKGLKSRRLAALEKLDWDIKIPDELPEGISKAQAEAQQTFLRSRYDLIENLTEAIGFLVSPEFRGYGILQKHRIEDGENDGAVRELHWLPQEVFSRNGSFGDFYYNQNSAFGIGLDTCQAVLGEQNRIGSEFLPRENFVIREIEAPLYEIALIAFVNWSMGRKDWAAFTEIFGLPNGVAIMPENVPSGREDEYRAAAEKVADGVSGALPYGSDIKFPTASVRGEAPFKSFCDAQDSDVVLAGTGGRLTMLTAEKGGLGNGPAKEHADAFDEIAQADARKISAVLQRDFDKIELAAEFPGQPAVAYFELSAVEEEDATKVVDNVQKLENVGLITDPAEVAEKVGLKLTRGPRPVQVPQPGEPMPGEPKIENRARRILNAAKEQASLDAQSQVQWLSAVAADLKPLADRLQAILDIADPEIRKTRLQALYDEMDGLSKDITADPHSAVALTNINVTQLANGALAAAEKRS